MLETLLDVEAHGPKMRVMVLDHRLPIALMAVLVGALLAVGGALMQTILNNPLAEPFTLGVASAASFDASMVIVLGFGLVPLAGGLLVTMNAFLFALLTCGLILVAARLKGAGSETMILFGIPIFFTFSALLALMQYRASEKQIAKIVFWIMGSLGRASRDKVALEALLLVAVVPFAMLRTWQLTTLRMGKEAARSMGVDVARLRVEMLICVSLLAATAVAFVGTVGFVGLVGPHIARFLVGETSGSSCRCRIDRGHRAVGHLYPVEIHHAWPDLSHRHHHLANRRAGLRVDPRLEPTGALGKTLHIEGLRVGYGRAPVLQDVTFAPIEPGQFAGVFGPRCCG